MRTPAVVGCEGRVIDLLTVGGDADANGVSSGSRRTSTRTDQEADPKRAS
jgi:hypothetical protein